MARINNVVTGGSNVVMVNGQIMSGDSDLKEIQLDKIERGGINKRISVCSEFTNITISPSLDQAIVAHLYGICSYTGEPPRLLFSENSGETKIEVICSADSVFGKISLDITVPKQKYDNIFASTTSGNVKIENISASKIQITTKSGDVYINCENDTSIVNTTSGNVVLKGIGSSYNITTSSGNITPKCRGNNFDLNSISGDVKGEIAVTSNSSVVDISTKSGNTVIKFIQVSRMDLRAKSVSGYRRNQFLETPNGYNANVIINSLSGNITIQ